MLRTGTSQFSGAKEDEMIVAAYASNVWVTFGFDPHWRAIGLIAAFAIGVCLVCLLTRRR